MIDVTDFIVYGKAKIKVDLAYNNVLKFFDLQADEILGDTDKINLAYRLLTKDAPNYGLKKKNEVIGIIYNDFINIKSKKQDGPQVLDFKQDAPHIFSSFWMDYHIDLTVDFIDWRKFIALFRGLSDRTKIVDIMSIRSRPIPERTKYNSAEIEHLKKLKEHYKIENPTTINGYENGLNKLGDMLRGQANR